MLTYLYIKNLAIIDELCIDFGRGLNILTGQTGAGKSVIIGALQQLLNLKKPKASLIRPNTNIAVIEAEFDISSSKKIKELLNIDEDILIIRKEITPQRTKSFVNRAVVSSSMIKNLANLLVDIASQASHLQLLNNYYQEEVLDNFAKVNKLKERIRRLYREFLAINEELRGIIQEEDWLNKEIDLLRYQIEEIEEARLVVGEEEGLYSLRQKLQNIDKIKRGVEEISYILDNSEGGFIYLSGKLLNKLNELRVLDGNQELSDFFENIYYSLEDFFSQFNKYAQNTIDKISNTTTSLNELEERIELINKLKNKYKCSSIEEILRYKEEAEKRLSLLSNKKLKKKDKEERLKCIKEKLKDLVIELSSIRIDNAKRLEELINLQLREVGLREACIFINVKRLPGNFKTPQGEFLLRETGIDEVEFLAKTNPDMPPQRLSAIASGGELSRFALVVKNVVSQTTDPLTVVFDEIDVGISGHIAEEVGKKLKNISKYHQVICITHLPQIAAYADKHFRVEKLHKNNRTFTSIKELSFSERVDELAKLLAGRKYDIATAKALAKQLIFIGE